MSSWNDDWRDELNKDNPEAYNRLCDCRNNRKDIIVIAKLMYKYNTNSHDKKECLDRTLEWITDWNNQANLYPDDDEYEKLLSRL